MARHIARQVFDPVDPTGQDVIGQVVISFMPGKSFGDIKHISELVMQGASPEILTLYRQSPDMPAWCTNMTFNLSRAVIATKRIDILYWMWVSYTPREVYEYMDEHEVVKLAYRPEDLEFLQTILTRCYHERDTTIWSHVLCAAMKHANFDALVWIINNLGDYRHPPSVFSQHPYSQGYYCLMTKYFEAATMEERNEYYSMLMLCFKRVDKVDEKGYYPSEVIGELFFYTRRYKCTELLERLQRLEGFRLTNDNSTRATKLTEVLLESGASTELIRKILPNDNLPCFYTAIFETLIMTNDAKFRNVSLEGRMMLCERLEESDYPLKTPRDWFNALVECRQYWMAEAVYVLYGGEKDPQMGLTGDMFRAICERGNNPLLLLRGVPVFDEVKSITVNVSMYPWAMMHRSQNCQAITRLCEERGIEILKIDPENVLRAITDFV